MTRQRAARPEPPGDVCGIRGREAEERSRVELMKRLSPLPVTGAVSRRAGPAMECAMTALLIGYGGPPTNRTSWDRDTVVVTELDRLLPNPMRRASMHLSGIPHPRA